MDKKLQFSQHLPSGKWLNVTINLEPLSMPLQHSFLLFVIINLFFLILLTWLLIRYSAPLQSIQKKAKALSKDIYDSPLDLNGPKIARNTFNEINKLQQQIQRLLKERTQLLAAISHDIRTPLTRMKLRTSLIYKKAQYQKQVQDIDVSVQYQHDLKIIQKVLDSFFVQIWKFYIGIIVCHKSMMCAL